MTETKAAIAELFYRGKLQEANGKFIPCDFSTGCFTLPFLLIGSFVPLIALVIALGQYTIRKPRSIINFYRKLQTLTFTTNLLIAVLILFAIGLAITLFWQGLPQLKLTLASLREALYQRKHNEFRYGLLLTENHLAIRCFCDLYDGQTIRLAQKHITSFSKEPLVFSKKQIVDISFCSERLETKQRIQYLVLSFFDMQGYIQRLRLPTPYLDIQLQQLFYQLKDWQN